MSRCGNCIQVGSNRSLPARQVPHVVQLPFALVDCQPVAPHKRARCFRTDARLDEVVFPSIGYEDWQGREYRSKDKVW